MLSLLHIENIAVIQSADILFGPGFNALTGETGAGKSIVVDSLSAVTGERTSRELIRTGAPSALVTGTFTGVRDLPWLRDNSLSPDENGELLLQREILPDGKNLCRVNGRPVTVAQLKNLGRQLLNIHGQQDGQQLLDEGCHLEYLENFGKTGNFAEKYREAYNRLCEIEAKIKAFALDEGEKARKLDVLNFQILELENANLVAGEEEEALGRRDLLRNAENLAQGMAAVRYALSGDEDTPGAEGLLSDACHALERLSGVSSALDELRERLEENRFQLQDLAETARDLQGDLDSDPGELDRIESRLDQLYRLKKKYGDSVEKMLEFLQKCQNERDEIQFSDEALAHLETQRTAALKEAKALAVKLSGERKTAGEALALRIQEELAQLDMPKVRFQVEFAEVDNENGLNSDGMDSVRFLMSANVGEALKPIQKIASGGELARIMLCLKNVLAEGDEVGTLVFDEVDTGVSGRAAQKVAQKLSEVARRKQVLCVTHLPQIAAMADVHFSVEKGEKDGRTYTAVEALSVERRRAELARLTSGDHITEASLASAGELLDGAEAYKKTL